MALAGLWKNWRSPAGERIHSFAIVTTPPNELCAELPISPRVGNAKNNDPSLIEPVVLPKVRRCG